jgi:hypothetical protein
MFVPFYTIFKQRLKIFWSSTPTNFSYEPALIPLHTTTTTILHQKQYGVKSGRGVKKKNPGINVSVQFHPRCVRENTGLIQCLSN